MLDGLTYEMYEAELERQERIRKKYEMEDYDFEDEHREKYKDDE